MLNHKVLGDGPSLIILHGLFGSLDNWITLGRRFAESYQVVLVDQRNHGKSFHSDAMNFELMSGDLAALMDDLQIETANLLGHSMGGKAVMDFTERWPERVEKLLVADIAPRAYKPRHNLIIEALQSLSLSSLTSRDDADEKLKVYIDDFGVRQFLLKNLSRKKEGGFEWKMNLEGIVGNYAHIIDRIEISGQFHRPVLFLKGDRSNYIDEEDESEIYRLYPNSEVVEIPNSGHWVHAENPDFFFNAVMGFLENAV